jgi:hypothetical protein
MSSSINANVHEPPSDLLLLSKLAVSSALARACRLSRYEAQLDEFLSKVEHVPAKLKAGNDSPLNKHEIVARYGELLELRQGLSLKEENLVDLPEWFWEDTGAEERRLFSLLPLMASPRTFPAPPPPIAYSCHRLTWFIFFCTQAISKKYYESSTSNEDCES